MAFNLRNYILRQLTRRTYGKKELALLLKRKGIPEEEGAPLLDEFEQLGFLNDAEWLKSKVEAYRYQGYGPDLIKRKLQEKGYSNIRVRECEASLERAIQKKLRSTQDKEKIIPYLLRRGFKYDQIKLNFNEIFKKLVN